MKREIDSRLLIGRSSSNDLVIDDQSISATHAEALFQGSRTRLVDLGSTNGTYVNGRRISAVEIVHGDRVHFGTFGTVFDGTSFVLEDNKPQNQILPPQKGDTPTLVGLTRLNQKRILAGGALALVPILFWLLGGQSGFSTSEIARATVRVVVSDDKGNDCWSGSGVLVVKSSMVVTNAHVAAALPNENSEFDNCQVLMIGISDDSGRNTAQYVEGELKAIDLLKDLAVIEILKASLVEDIKPLQIRTSEPKLEETVRVFGFPEVGGESLTVSKGIISGLDQSRDYPYLKVTADISSGNSGGPVVDSRGLLIGIATAINRQSIDCSEEGECFSNGNSLGLVRPIALLSDLISIK